jgi:hypothetical protein
VWVSYDKRSTIIGGGGYCKRGLDVNLAHRSPRMGLHLFFDCLWTIGRCRVVVFRCAGCCAIVTSMSFKKTTRTSRISRHHLRVQISGSHIRSADSRRVCSFGPTERICSVSRFGDRQMPVCESPSAWQRTVGGRTHRGRHGALPVAEASSGRND